MSDTHHIVPIKTYLKVFIALLFLTFITVALAKVDFGSMNIVVALLIASSKAALVFLWFMGLKYQDWMNRVIVISSLFFVILLGALVAADVWSRMALWFVS